MDRYSNYETIANLNGADMTEQGVQFAMTLPDYVDRFADRILVNHHRIGQIARWGGIGETVIINHSRDSERPVPSIAGFDGPDTATAYSAASVQTVARQETSLKQDVSIPYMFRWSRATISINDTEIESVQQKGESLHDAQLWARYLDMTIKQGLRDKSWPSLDDKNYGRFAFFVTGISLAAMSTIIVNDFQPEAIEAVAATGGLYFANNQALNALMLGKVRKPYGLEDAMHRNSLFHGLQLDRLAMVYALTHIGKVAVPARDSR